MHRRVFVSGLVLAGLASPASGGPRSAVAPLIGGSICRASAAPRRPAAAADDSILRYEGTHILTYGAMREIAAALAGRLVVRVRGGGCDNAILGVGQNTSDIGGMCCPIVGSRAEGLSSLLVARDMKVVVAHPEVAVTDLELDALKALARGVVADWSELGGGRGPIALIVREHCADKREPVQELLLERPNGWSRRALKVESDQHMVESVARLPRAVGISSWVFARPLVEAGRLRLLAIDGALPNRDTVNDGRYPLWAPLSIIFREWRPATMQPLFDFIYGARGRAIISKRLVPVTAAEGGYA